MDSYKKGIILKYLTDQNMKILDVGCGKGEVSNWLNSIGYKNIVSTDIYRCNAINFKLQDIMETDYSKFDLIILWAVLPLVNKNKVMEKLEREMKKEAVLIISVANICAISRRLRCLFGRSPHTNNYHCHSFTFKEMRLFLDNYNFSEKIITSSYRDYIKKTKFITPKNFSNDIIVILKK